MAAHVSLDNRVANDSPLAPGRVDLIGLRAMLDAGETTSVRLTTHYLDRIADINDTVHAVAETNRHAIEEAGVADGRRASGATLGPLDGIPLLVKDNIDTAGLATTAGSRLLSPPPVTDAEIVARARANGAVLLGKTALSEWANFRSVHATEGWSATGGQVRNPFDTRRSPWGSSAGSAVAVAAGMAPLALGTETDGSIVGPAGVNGVVGVKPEPGLLPGGGIVPISMALDSVGVLARSVTDAATCVACLSGTASDRGPYAPSRIGRWRVPGTPACVDALLDEAVEALRAGGCVVDTIEFAVPDEVLRDGLLAMYAEFRPSLEHYLSGRPGVPDSLRELVAANRDDPVELKLFGQDLFEWADGVTNDERAEGFAARGRSRDAARDLLRDTLRHNGVDVLLAPTNEPAWPIDHERGDGSRLTSSTAAALAGHPIVSIPVGCVDGLPVGMSLFGPSRLSDLLPVASAVERHAGVPTWPALP